MLMLMLMPSREPRAIIGALLRLTPAIVLAGCSTARVDVSRHDPFMLADNEAIVLLARRKQEDSEPEEAFMDCLAEGLDSAGSRLTLYPQQTFVDTLFPWFEPRTAPESLGDLNRLLKNPVLSSKLESTKVRFVIWVEGSTETVGEGGAINCAVGPGGGGCLGFVWWEKDSSYEVSIWDLKRSETAAALSATANGTSYLPAVVIPIPLIARPQNAACEGLAGQIEAMLSRSGDQ